MYKNEALEKRKWVRLTKACNNHCIFCLDEDMQDGHMVPYDDIINDLKLGIRERCERAVLSGGDPTIHPDLIKIIKEASNIGYKHIQLISNGRMFCYKDFLAKAVEAGLSEITFSVHGYNAAVNDKLTGVKGSFVQTITGLKNALSVKGLIVNCDIVVNKMNVKKLSHMISFLHSLGVYEFDVLNLIPFGRAWKNWDKLYFDCFEHKDDLMKAFDYNKKLGVKIWANRFPPELFEGNEYLIQHPEKIRYEVFGREEMFNRYLQDKIKPECMGVKCQYCVLKNFCKDLTELLSKKNLEQFIPLCGKENITRIKTIAYPAKLNDIYKFFVKCRYNIKSSKCGACKYSEQCRGVGIFDVMKKGFNVIPI